MEDRKVTCDGCGADITSTGNSVDYRLVLASEKLPIRGPTCTDMYIRPPLATQAHFCGMACLDHWSDRRRHYWSLLQERRDSWVNQHGTRIDDGRIVSYPGKPLEDENRDDEECKEKALDAFPMKRRK